MIPLWGNLPFWFVAAPEIILLGLICTVLIADLFVDDEHRNITFWLSIATLLLTMYVIFATGGGRQVVFDGAYVSDPLSLPEFGETEDLTIETIPFTEALERVLRGKITDAVSVASILRLWAERERFLGRASDE